MIAPSPADSRRDRPRDRRAPRRQDPGTSRLGSSGRAWPSQRQPARPRARRTACRADDDGWPPLRFHDLRHTFASHLIIDVGLDVSPGQPHPRPRAHHDHARHLHASLRGRAPRARHPDPHGRQPVRRPARARDSHARRHGPQAPIAGELRGETHSRTRSRAPNVPRKLRRGLGPIETAALPEKEARADPHNGRPVLVRCGERAVPPGRAFLSREAGARLRRRTDSAALPASS
jgi:hypothetical protein